MSKNYSFFLDLSGLWEGCECLEIDLLYIMYFSNVKVDKYEHI